MDIQKFDFKGSDVRLVLDGKGDPWWIAKDVCDVLEFRDTNDGIKYLDPDDVSTCPDNSSGQVRHVKIINEPGLYSLILRSRKPEAKEFKRWVTHEVLPAIRKTGGYIATKVEDTPDVIMARALVVAQDTPLSVEQPVRLSVPTQSYPPM